MGELHLISRAERRGGELLAEMEKNPGRRPGKNQLHDATSLSDLGIEKTQSHRWQIMHKGWDAGSNGQVPASTTYSHKSGDAQKITRLVATGGWMPVFARGHPGQCYQMAPAKRRPGRGELLADSAVVLLGVESPVLTDRVLEKQIK